MKRGEFLSKLVVEVDCFELCNDVGHGGLMEVVIVVDGASTTKGISRRQD
jgi:hypothetical protein